MWTLRMKCQSSGLSAGTFLKRFRGSSTTRKVKTSLPANEASGNPVLAPGTYTFSGVDSYGDGWNGNDGTATSYRKWQCRSFELHHQCLLAGGWDYVYYQNHILKIIVQCRAIPGCTDPLANNYNENATEDDGSCCFENVVTFTLGDTYGDGWSFKPILRHLGRHHLQRYRFC